MLNCSFPVISFFFFLSLPSLFLHFSVTLRSRPRPFVLLRVNVKNTPARRARSGRSNIILLLLCVCSSSPGVRTRSGFSPVAIRSSVVEISVVRRRNTTVPGDDGFTARNRTFRSSRLSFRCYQIFVSCTHTNQYTACICLHII